MLAISEMLVAIETLCGNALIWREVAFVCWQEPGVDTPRALAGIATLFRPGASAFDRQALCARDGRVGLGRCTGRAATAEPSRWGEGHFWWCSAVLLAAGSNEAVCSHFFWSKDSVSLLKWFA